MASKKSNCGVLAIGCATILLLVVGIAYYAYCKVTEIARQKAAQVVEYGVGELVKTQLSQEQAAEIMKPVKEFTGKIRDGSMGATKALRIGQKLFTSPIIPAITAMAFEKKYILTPEVPEFFKNEGRLTISRFVKAIMSGRVKEEQTGAVMQIITIEKVENNRKRHVLKEKLTQEELQKCLKLMKDTCDQLKIPEEKFEINLADEVRKVLQEADNKP